MFTYQNILHLFPKKSPPILVADRGLPPPLLLLADLFAKKSFFIDALPKAKWGGGL